MNLLIHSIRNQENSPIVREMSNFSELDLEFSKTLEGFLELLLNMWEMFGMNEGED